MSHALGFATTEGGSGTAILRKKPDRSVAADGEFCAGRLFSFGRAMSSRGGAEGAPPLATVAGPGRAQSWAERSLPRTTKTLLGLWMERSATPGLRFSPPRAVLRVLFFRVLRVKPRRSDLSVQIPRLAP